ncbi:MAG TPA: NarL family transcriptional regulator [Flavobacteriales bacterium]|nr:NarL family transcriptional regulator [Flavobacteriales bacterium]
MRYLKVPYGLTVHGEEEIQAVNEVLRTSTQMGKNVREFEEKIATLYDKKHGIMVNSGSSALYLAMEVLGLEKGDEVITPALTFSTTVGSIVKSGLVPAFVDVEEGTYNLNVNLVEELITSRTKAMLIPNLLGNLPDWKKLREIANAHNLTLIEDSADTLGALINGKSSGRFTDISTTSFYGSHVINCAGNGGMVCFNDDEQAKKAKLLRSWGRSSSLFVESEAIENRFNVEVDGIPYDAKFIFSEMGYNIEPSEMGAAFGLVQLKKLDQNIDGRAKNVDIFNDFFGQYKKWFIRPRQLADSRTGWLAYAVTIRDEAPFKRRDLQIFLEKRGIQTRTVFTGNILRQPGFKSIERKESKLGYPESDRVMRGGMLIGCHHGLTEEMIAHMKACLTEFLDSHS